MKKWRYEIKKNGELVDEGVINQSPWDFVWETWRDHLPELEDIHFDTDRTTDPLRCTECSGGICAYAFGFPYEEGSFETWCRGSCTWEEYYIKDKRSGEELHYRFEEVGR